MLSPSASSQDFSNLGFGELTASSYEPFPDRAPIAVGLLDDSELNSRLRDDARAAIKASGRPLDHHSSLILYLSTEITGQDGKKKSGSFARLYGDSEHGVDLSLNVYSDTTDSLITGAKKEKPGRVIYRLIGEVRRGADVLWQGRVVTEESLGDTYRTFKPMVQTLVDALGETEVPEEPAN